MKQQDNGGQVRVGRPHRIADRPGRLIYPELGYAVIGCARCAHSALGPGFPERVCHRALCLELPRSRLPFVSESRHEVTHGGAVCGQFKVDVFVDVKIILELKAVSDLCWDHASQAYSYLKAPGAGLAVVVNFGKRRPRRRRVVMSYT